MRLRRQNQLFHIEPRLLQRLAYPSDKNGESYYLGVFLVGAYQEILGDMHNLFGDTNTVHVSVHKDGYEIEQIIDGETVAEVLDYVQYNPKNWCATSRLGLHAQ